MSRPFAVFDIDGTLIRWQLFHSIVMELAKRGLIDASAADSINEARLTWKKRTHSESFREYEELLVHVAKAAMIDVPVADYDQAVEAVFSEYKDQVYTYTRDLIRQLKAENYLLFAISGSHHEAVGKIAEYYGFDDYYGAQFQQANGRFTGEVIGPLGRKAEVVRELTTKHNVDFAGSVAVGDTAGDAAMLELVERPIAFNPNRELFDIATEHTWPIVVERKNVIYRLEARNGRYCLATEE